MNNRLQILEQAGYNTLNINSEHVPYDLQTDSWPELGWPHIFEKITQLQSHCFSASDLNLELKKIFPYQHMLAVSQGRFAEFFLCHVLIKKGGIIPQNLLFPTTRYHQILKRAMPKEIPVSDVLDKTSSNYFKGNLDIEQLEQILSSQSETVPFIYIELANNAAGGYSVSMTNIKAIYQLARQYKVSIILDTTRMIENAIFIQRYENGYQDQSVADIILEICRHSDGMTMSLGKDYGLDRGGIIATNDERVFARIQDQKLALGTGLSRLDRKIISHCMSNWSLIEQNVHKRIQQAHQLYQALRNANINVITPASTHCVVIDLADMAAFKSLNAPVQAFTAHLFLQTGIRGGLHNSGMNRSYARPHWIRFALPLECPDEAITTISQLMITALKDNTTIVDLKKINSGIGLNAGLTAHYQRI